MLKTILSLPIHINIKNTSVAVFGPYVIMQSVILIRDLTLATHSYLGDKHPPPLTPNTVFRTFIIVIVTTRIGYVR